MENIRQTGLDGGGEFLAGWRQRTLTRRQWLLTLAGGSLAALFPGAWAAEEFDGWTLLDAVQQHLFPSEPEAPGAREINALAYLRWVVSDRNLPQADRDFIHQGAGWLEALSRERRGVGFLQLDEEGREVLLQEVSRSPAGENWLATLLLYLFEALLCDPVYGGNPDAIGWRWLGHRPGFPRPTGQNRYRAG
jgi:gluconate 2-dehydrogenase gamma chain